jgi:UDP-N-acetylglucosamine:LPS N-acetylglucosamine transferase
VGSGTNRDVISLIDRIVMACRGHSELQIVIAEWLNSLTRLDLWNDVTIVSGFPLSRIFNAFDFSIAAAGYNTFHEVTVFGLPTLYVANPQRHMDDQVARAEFAAQRGAAIASNGSMDMLEQGIQRLMQPKVRSRMRSAMRRLVRPNGARAAARAIESLFEKE